MRVIFLDVDGVLINRHSCKVGFGVTDPDCVKTLNTVIAKTGAKLVISSCWRVGRTVPELQDLMGKWKVVGEVIDKTEVDYDVVRGVEIQRWLDKHPEVQSFVIIDDDSDMGDLLPYLAKTKFESGFTKSSARIATEILTIHSKIEDI